MYYGNKRTKIIMRMVGMLIQKIDDEVQLRMFYEDDAEEFST